MSRFKARTAPNIILPASTAWAAIPYIASQFPAAQFSPATDISDMPLFSYDQEVQARPKLKK
jgi:hypothetical protein